ncbi:hypothetical protein EK21DRAFT_58078, partial [Setomelanomma holmii]
DFCHKRSIKCRPSATDQRNCQNCYDFDVSCTYDRPQRRGRATFVSKSFEGSTTSTALSTQDTQQQRHDLHPGQYLQSGQGRLRPATQVPNAEATVSATGSSVSPVPRRPGLRYAASRAHKSRLQDFKGEKGPEAAWQAFAAASIETIEHLVDVYLQVVHPIFPLFHQYTLLQKVRDHEHLRDRGFFTSLMAACALASARGRDGALYGSNVDAVHADTVPSETFFAAAEDTLPKDFIAARDFNYLRACALLAITSIQYGDIEAMQLYLGHYFTLAGIHKFHDETCWPKGITNIEVEERRRLYWSTYTLDIYSSLVWNGSIHAHGANARVRYPTEVEDEFITPLATLPSPQPASSWLRGWNFTTDLYLTLEQATNRLRARYDRIDDRIDVAAVFGMSTLPSATVLASINAQYDTLPTHFKTFASPTGDRGRDIYGFQAANIQATILLLRMVFLCADDDRRVSPDVQLKCNVAAELLAVFQTIPTAYLCGISTPLIYHLAGIGTILGSVMESPLSEAGYQQVRGMLLSIADLLERLESGLSRAADISKGLRTQVERIDEYMRDQCRPVTRAQEQPHDANAAGPSGSRQHVQMAPDDVGGIEQNDLQLPPELLEDWPWPFNLQPDSWSFLGSG